MGIILQYGNYRESGVVGVEYKVKYVICRITC